MTLAIAILRAHQRGFSFGGVLRGRGGEIKIVGRSSTKSFLHEIMPVLRLCSCYAECECNKKGFLEIRC